MIHCEAKRDDIDVTMGGTRENIVFEFLTIIGVFYVELLKDHTREDARKAMKALLKDGIDTGEAAARRLKENG